MRDMSDYTWNGCAAPNTIVVERTAVHHHRKIKLI